MVSTGIQLSVIDLSTIHCILKGLAGASTSNWHGIFWTINSSVKFLMLFSRFSCNFHYDLSGFFKMFLFSKPLCWIKQRVGVDLQISWLSTFQKHCMWDMQFSPDLWTCFFLNTYLPFVMTILKSLPWTNSTQRVTDMWHPLRLSLGNFSFLMMEGPVFFLMRPFFALPFEVFCLLK